MKERSVSELFDLSGKTAIVTGGTGWLGSALCRALAEANAQVVVTSRDRSRACDTAKSLVDPLEQGHRGIALDQTNPQSIAEAFREVMDVVGPVDVLVNNALEALGDDLTTVRFEQFAHHQLNNAGYFELSRHVHAQAVARSAAASIINLGSMYGQVASYPDAYRDIGPASSVAYHVLKGGTLQLTRHLAVYWAKDHVRVNCLSPGPFPNPGSAAPELIDRLKAKVPLGRMGEPWELKGAIVFLASDASSYVTGQTLTVDGGWTAW